MVAPECRVKGLGFSLKAKQGYPELMGRGTRKASGLQEENSGGNVPLERGGESKLGAGNPDRKPLQYSGRKMTELE